MGEIEFSTCGVTISPEEAKRIVVGAARLYFESRRVGVGPFVDRHFSFRGSLSLHRKALGWDVLRAPINLVLAMPYVALRVIAAIARALRANRVANYLGSRRILLQTAVAREIEWLVMTELLELPFRQGDRVSPEDALARMILASEPIRAATSPLFDAIGRRSHDPAFRERLARSILTYAETRAAAADITTTLITLGAGAAALKQVTPGAMVLGPALASVMAQQAAVASFPLGTTLGGLWYGAFPVSASPGLVVGMTGGLMATGAVLAAFSGVIADPLQRRLGLHRRRLLRLIDTLERQFTGNPDSAYITCDHYVARLLASLELLSTAYRLARF